MDILYLLIPLSAVLILGIVAVFGWAVYSGQFDGVEEEGRRILSDEGPVGPDRLDIGQEKQPATGRTMQAVKNRSDDGGP